MDKDKSILTMCSIDEYRDMDEVERLYASPMKTGYITVGTRILGFGITRHAEGFTASFSNHITTSVELVFE